MMTPALLISFLSLLMSNPSPSHALPEPELSQAPVAEEVASIILNATGTERTACPGPVITYYAELPGVRTICAMSPAWTDIETGTVDEALAGWPGVEPLVTPTTPWVESGTSITRAYKGDGVTLAIRVAIGAVLIVALPTLSVDAAAAPPPTSGTEPPKEEITNPVRVAATSPEYPDLARRHDIEGRVFLEAVIERNGRVSSVRLLGSTVPGFGFEAASVKAVRQWRYRPGMKDGKPVRVNFNIMVDFEMEIMPAAE